MAPSPPKFKLPRIHRVQLRRFSLFAANPNAQFSAGDGVLCLIGANGVGKSTLLSAINFCLTGTVPDPNRTFESIDEYYKYTRAYSGTYFRGRIAGSDEDDAEITLTFSVGEFEYEVRRGLFEPGELRGLKIGDHSKGTKASSIAKTDKMPRSERHQLYATSLVEHTGLASFEEFVFLQHFVFTFDEQRKTLFWTPRIIERVLYRAFGLDPNMAKQADSIRREYQHEDSRVRNYQWEATRMRKRINEIRAQNQQVSGAQNKYESLVAEHEKLSEQFDEQTKELRNEEDALNDASLRLADLSVRETALRDEYARFFDRRFDRRPSLARHPIVIQSLDDKACGLCGNSGPKVLATISKKANASVCPLCDSEISTKPPATKDASRLAKIDQELNHLKKSIKDVHKTIESLQAAVSKARRNWEATKEHLDEFDRENSTTLDGLRKLLKGIPNEASLSDYREQLAVLEKDKKIAQERREHLKSQQLRLQRELEGSYLEVEKSFVPTFEKLARRFLGMPLSVQMEAKATDDVKLIVTVRGTTRRQLQQLSESQRFFLDIALRMALTQQMSNPVSPGGMLIDTPEGSLDIAYEKRAGDMLAMFALAGHQIIMTANLNTSRLLLELAKACGHSGMQLCRIMDWAELSEVQQEEEGLFDDAYHQIELAMDSLGPRNDATKS
jgi:DNA repair exonuclease SbcCD ATPase subunit